MIKQKQKYTEVNEIQYIQYYSMSFKLFNDI